MQVAVNARAAFRAEKLHRFTGRIAFYAPACVLMAALFECALSHDDAFFVVEEDSVMAARQTLVDEHVVTSRSGHRRPKDVVRDAKVVRRNRGLPDMSAVVSRWLLVADDNAYGRARSVVEAEPLTFVSLTNLFLLFMVNLVESPVIGVSQLSRAKLSRSTRVTWLSQLRRLGYIVTNSFGDETTC